MQKLSHIIRPYGRKLYFAQYGDIRGFPVFYFHGWPATHVSAAIYDRIAKKLGVRIIAPDRPGFGMSDYLRGRSLLDWSDDVVALADFLRIKRFSVMGVSGGAPFALACAYKIPRRLIHIGVVVGAAPLKEYTKGRRFDWRLWVGGVSLIRSFLVWIQYLNTFYGISIHAYRFLWGAADRNLYRDSALLRRGHETMKEAFRNGLHGPAYELEMMTKDWGFRLADIKRLVYLWYGGDDYPDVVKMGYFYARRLPYAKFTLYPHEGHLVSVTRIEEILSVLRSV